MHYRPPNWLLGTILIVIFAPCVHLVAQDKSLKFGREAREGTPILNRDPSSPLDRRERIHHVVSRFTFGATPELLDHVAKIGVEEWLKEQLQGEAEESAVLRDHLSRLESLDLNCQELVQKYRPKLASLQQKLTPEQLRERSRLHAMQKIPRNELKDAVLLRSVYGNNQLREVASDFWRNHFNVDVSKGAVGFYATEYERDVIRGEALGSFHAMLNKQARHPAMLVYLDNFISRAAPRKELIKVARDALARTRDYYFAMEALDIARMRGINENYARELMELHTLGVDNYYTQADVLAVADALTGWTVQQNVDEPITFQFRPDMHATGNRIFLRRRIPASPQDPEREGQAILDILVRHRGTSEFIAYKLCRHFVTDSPPEDMVKRVASVYMRDKSDLPAIYQAIVNDPDFYNPEYYQAKFKRPTEFLASALRVTNAEITSTKYLHRELLSMCEPIYQCEDPTGYYDQADAWRDPGVMAPRWQFALGLGMGWVRGVRIPESYWEDLKPNNPLQWKEVLTSRILPMGCSPQTDIALDNVIRKYSRFNPEPDQLGRYIVGILLGSPEFQRQ